MRYLKLFINIMILGIVFIFFAQNYEVLQYSVQLQMGFFFSSPYQFPAIPLYMLLLFVFGLAVSIILLLVGKEVFSLRLMKRRLECTIKEQERELVSLRTLPLKEQSVSKPLQEEVSHGDTVQE